ncbi:MAG TPA: hypothetical protein VIM55_10830 [Mucilaginibacter sp.]
MANTLFYLRHNIVKAFAHLWFDRLTMTARVLPPDSIFRPPHICGSTGSP